MTGKSGILSPRPVAAAILALGGIATYFINFPGSMEDDSFVQLLEGRTGSYGFWHPPVMSWMLGISDMLPGPPAAWFVLFDMALAFGALASVLWLARRVSWRAAACAAAMLPLPQLFLLEAVVWKDVLFADACLAGFLCIAHAGERWERAQLRCGLLAGAAAFLALAMLARQNGAAVLPFAVVGLVWIAARAEKRWRAAAVYGAALLVASAGLTLAADAAFALRWNGAPATEAQFEMLRFYDLTGMAKRRPAVIGAVESDAPDVARVIADEGVRRWSPVKNDTLELSPRIVAMLDATPPETMERAWRDAVSLYPGTWLAVRAQLFLWVFQPPDVGLCHPYHVGEEGNPADLKKLGLGPRMDRRDYALLKYAAALRGTPAYSHGAFALICLGVFVVVLRRRRPADLAIAALIAGVAAFTATYFLISIACDYRYMFVIDLTALAGGLYLAADRPTKRGPEGPL